MEPIKVFFVDDEPIVISDLLTRIDWESEGFDVKGCAYSAEAALHSIKEYMPDLVFVDVALPGMSGLELSAKIREINSNTIIVILSGYMEFDYAQKAMSIGVLTYLVKHQLTAESLLSTLNKVRETFVSRKSADTMIKKQLLIQLFRGERTYEQMQTQQQSYLGIYTEPFQIMGFRPWAPYFYRKDPQWAVRPEFEELLMEKSFEEFQILDTVVYQNMVVVFAKISNNYIGTKALISAAHHCCVTIKEYLAQKTGTSFAAAYHTKMSTLQSLENDVSQLDMELDRSIFNQKQVGAARLISKKAQTDYSYITKQAFINDHNRSMETIKDGLESAWRNKRLIDFVQCTDKILQLLKALNIDLLENNEAVSQLYTAQEVSEYLLKVLSRARQFNAIKEEYSATTIYVLEYINSNYNKNPSINEVAGKLNSSGMYIGQKIKKETGKTFNDFLTECRMYHAEALLCETNLKISEISRRIGIANSQYFRKIFQEFTGQSPNDYRKQLLIK